MPRQSREDLTIILDRPGYTVAPGIHHAQPQHPARQEPLVSHQAEAKGAARVEVRITRFATKSLDKDNLYGSAKYLCDALRKEKLIPDDDPDSIELVVVQMRVSKRVLCGTRIEITPL